LYQSDTMLATYLYIMPNLFAYLV